MKIYKLQNKVDKKIDFFLFKQNNFFKIKSNIYENDITFEKSPINIKSYTKLPPVNPTKIICLAINYDGITGFKKSMKEPLVFLKSPNALTIKKNIKLAFLNQKAWGEPELGVIIKRKLKNIKKLNKKRDVLGYILANDISCYNIEKRDHHLARAKSADNFCPTTDFFITDYDYKFKKISCAHNSKLLRNGTTDQMMWDVNQILSWLSSWMTLLPGDLVLTGSPPRIRDRQFFKINDTFEIFLEDFGSLKNKVI